MHALPKTATAKQILRSPPNLPLPTRTVYSSAWNPSWGLPRKGKLSSLSPSTADNKGEKNGTLPYLAFPPVWKIASAGRRRRRVTRSRKCSTPVVRQHALDGRTLEILDELRTIRTIASAIGQLLWSCKGPPALGSTALHTVSRSKKSFNKKTEKTNKWKSFTTTVILDNKRAHHVLRASESLT